MSQTRQTRSLLRKSVIRKITCKQIGGSERRKVCPSATSHLPALFPGLLPTKVAVPFLTHHCSCGTAHMLSWEAFSPLLLALSYITLSGISSQSDVCCCALLLRSLHYLACWQSSCYLQMLPAVIANCHPEIWDSNTPSNCLYRAPLTASLGHGDCPLIHPFLGLQISY